MKSSLPYYENVEFTLSNGQTDYDLDANQSDFLSIFNTDATSNVPPTYVSIRTNNTISVKVNSTSNHSITITSSDSPFVIDGVRIQNLYLTNASGSDAAVKLYFQFSPNNNDY